MTGLYEHFEVGCPNDDWRNKNNIRISLIDYVDKTAEKLQRPNHKKGNCKCLECEKLGKVKNKWIMILGTFYGESGLNGRNIINSWVRVQF